MTTETIRTCIDCGSADAEDRGFEPDYCDSCYRKRCSMGNRAMEKAPQRYESKPTVKGMEDTEELQNIKFTVLMHMKCANIISGDDCDAYYHKPWKEIKPQLQNHWEFVEKAGMHVKAGRVMAINALLDAGGMVNVPKESVIQNRKDHGFS